MVIEHIAPHCRPFPGEHSIVVMDNATVHHDTRVRELIEATGARLFFLPCYANNLNPIEEAFSKVKRFLQRHRELASQPKFAIALAFQSITAEDCAGYFHHAGYTLRTEVIIEGVLEFYS